MGVGTSVPRQMQCCQSGNGPAWKAEAGLKDPRRFDPFTLRQMLRYAGRLRSLPRKQRVPDEGMGGELPFKLCIPQDKPDDSGVTTALERHAADQDTDGKYMRDGRLFIRRDGKTYNAQGMLMK